MKDYKVEGIIVYFVVHFVWVLIFLPPTWLTLAGGIIYSSIYGFWGGFACATILGTVATILSGTTSYLISSKLFSECLQ